MIENCPNSGLRMVQLKRSTLLTHMKFHDRKPIQQDDRHSGTALLLVVVGSYPTYQNMPEKLITSLDMTLVLKMDITNYDLFFFFGQGQIHHL